MIRPNKQLRNTFKSIIFSTTTTNFLAQSIAFNLRYRHIDKKLFKKTLSNEVIKNYRKKWNRFGYPVELKTLLLSYNLSGVVDLNIVPENIFAAVIEPQINYYKDKQLSLISTKNFYEKWFNDPQVFPMSYLHKIDNIFYDQNLERIEDLEAYFRNNLINYPVICKPSLGTAGGEGVKSINTLEELKASLDTYNHLVVQEKIKQNGYLNTINPGINSIRTCLYRDLSGKFKVLNNSIRFGINGSLDNETAGGIVCNIKNDGRLNRYAVSKYCDTYTEHPNSKVIFDDIKIPKYDNLMMAATKIADQIPLCNLVSLDMCLDSNNNWRCIEINLDNQTIRFSQYAGKGFFGDFTDEVIDRVLRGL